MREQTTIKNIVFACFLCLPLAWTMGCSQAIRSDAVRQLVEKEQTSLARLHEGLQQQEGTIEQGTRDLKESSLRRLDSLKSREKELREFQIHGASLQDSRDLLVRQAASASLARLARLEVDRSDMYTKLQQDFDSQADALLESYKKILAATAKMKEQIKEIDTYVHTSQFRFAAESIDTASIQAALLEFEEGKAFLEKAAKAGNAIEKILGPASALDQDVRMHELLETLSLLSSRLQQLKQP